jgi:hypothetical protein
MLPTEVNSMQPTQKNSIPAFLVFALFIYTRTSFLSPSKYCDWCQLSILAMNIENGELITLHISYDVNALFCEW